MGSPEGDCDDMRGLTASEVTTLGASRASHRPAAPPGTRWRPGPLRTPPPRADHAVPLGAAARGQLHHYTEAGTGAELPQFIKDEFDAFL